MNSARPELRPTRSELTQLDRSAPVTRATRVWRSGSMVMRVQEGLVRGLGRRDKNRLGPVELRKQTFEVGDLRQVLGRDVGLARVQGQVILMVRLGRIELPARFDHGDDRGGEDMRLVELGDVGSSDAGLLRIG